ncbi:MAG: hypothetical protein GYA23_01440 [Methanomicrobiales archaeon]|nr:hypothetical protein [Methanomicrobiales archaeon]
MITVSIIILQPFPNGFKFLPSAVNESGELQIDNRSLDIEKKFQKQVTIVSVSQKSERGEIILYGVTDLPEGSAIRYEIISARINDRKKGSGDIDMITGVTLAQKKGSIIFWSGAINCTSWYGGKYFITAFPEKNDTRYGDSKEFYLPLNETISRGAGNDAGDGEIILNELLPSQVSTISGTKSYPTTPARQQI